LFASLLPLPCSFLYSSLYYILLSNYFGTAISIAFLVGPHDFQSLFFFLIYSLWKTQCLILDGDQQVMNWKVYGIKWSWPNWGIIQTFASRNWGTHENPQDSLCLSGDSKRLPAEQKSEAFLPEPSCSVAHVISWSWWAGEYTLWSSFVASRPYYECFDIIICLLFLWCVILRCLQHRRLYRERRMIGCTMNRKGYGRKQSWLNWGEREAIAWKYQEKPRRASVT
jgi:hypothetical protein